MVVSSFWPQGHDHIAIVSAKVKRISDLAAGLPGWMFEVSPSSDFGLAWLVCGTRQSPSPIGQSFSQRAPVRVILGIVRQQEVEQR